MRYSVISILVGIVLISAQVAADDGVATKKLLENLQLIKTLQADFTQESFDTKNTLLQKQNGSFKVKESGEFIWNIAAPFEQKIISDGKTLKIFDPDLEQLTIKSLDKKVQVIPLLLFSGESEQISQQYNISSAELNVFELAAKNKNSLFENLQINFVDEKPESLVIMDGLKQKTVVKFKNVITNQVLKSSSFQFETPAGVDVIDER